MKKRQQKKNPWQNDAKYPMTVRVDDEIKEYVREIQAAYKYKSQADAVRRIIQDHKDKGNKK